MFLQHLAVVRPKETTLSASVSRYALAGTMQGAEYHLIIFIEHSNTVPLTYYLFRNIIAHFKMSYLGILQHIFNDKQYYYSRNVKKWIQINVRHFLLLGNLTEKKYNHFIPKF